MIETRLIRRVVVSVVVFSVAVLVAGSSFATSPAPRFGQIPDSASRADGSVDMAQVPEFVSVLDAEGNIAGYVRRDDLFGGSSAVPASPAAARQAAAEAPLEVFDREQQLVGHMVAGVGFVALGDPVPDVDPRVAGSVTEGTKDATG